MSVRPPSGPHPFGPRLRRLVATAGLCGAGVAAAGLTGCGATGANLAQADGGSRKWWSPPAALAKVPSLSPFGLTPDASNPVPGSRDELKNPAALDLAYANLRKGGGGDGGGRSDAEAAYHRVLKDDPKNVEALIGLARLTETNAGDRPEEIKEAGEAYQAAVDAAPGDARPLLALARFQGDQRRWGESAATYGRAAERATDTRQRRTARHGMAVATVMTGDIEGAREHFVASVGEASAHFNIGELYRRAGDRDAALREFRLAEAKKTADHPHLDQIGPMIAALEAAGPSGVGRPAAPPAAGPVTPAPLGVDPAPTRLAGAARPAATPPTDPFAGDAAPYGRNPVRLGSIRPASTTAPPRSAAPATYTQASRPPMSIDPLAAPRTAPVAPPVYTPPAASTDAATPPPWPFPTGG